MRGKIGEVLGRSSAGELSLEQQRQEERFKVTCAAVFGAIKPDGISMIDVIHSVEGDVSIRRDDIKPAIWALLNSDNPPVDGRWLAMDWGGNLYIRQPEEVAEKDNSSR